MVLAEAELLKGQADLLEQENRKAEMSISASKIQGEAISRSEKLQSETNLNIAKVSQEQQKIDDARFDNAVKNGIEMAKAEWQAEMDLNAQVQNNLQVTNANI